MAKQTSAKKRKPSRSSAKRGDLFSRQVSLRSRYRAYRAEGGADGPNDCEPSRTFWVGVTPDGTLQPFQQQARPTRSPSPSTNNRRCALRRSAMGERRIADRRHCFEVLRDFVSSASGSAGKKPTGKYGVAARRGFRPMEATLRALHSQGMTEPRQRKNFLSPRRIHA